MINRLDDRESTIISALRRLTIELDHLHHRNDRAEPAATVLQLPRAVRVEARGELHRRAQAEPTLVQGVVVRAEQRARAPEIENRAPREIDIGDIVRITNSYKNLRGTVGQLIKKTRCRGTIETESGATYVQSLDNLDLA